VVQAAGYLELIFMCLFFLLVILSGNFDCVWGFSEDILLLEAAVHASMHSFAQLLVLGVFGFETRGFQVFILQLETKGLLLDVLDPGFIIATPEKGKFDTLSLPQSGSEATRRGTASKVGHLERNQWQIGLDLLG
jgi:hypothetical protein